MRYIGSKFLPLAVVADLALLPGVSAAYQERGYAGAAAGEWSGGGKYIPGPPDGQCSNMGAVEKVNLASNFGFNIPNDATITGVTAYIKAGAQGGQTIGVQLASDATDDPPVLLGAQRSIAVTNAATGSCAETAITSVNGGLASWGPPTPALTPAIVNNAAFGLVFTKLQKSEVKVDAVCMEIAYSGSTTGVQQSCFQDVTNTIIVVKEVVGNPPGTDWEFTFGNGEVEGFTLPAAGGTKTFEGLEDDASYRITETLKTGWTTSVECTDGTTGGNGVTVEFDEEDEGVVVTCTFTNTAPTPPASIRVSKVLAAGSPTPADPWYFSFEGEGDFFLNAGDEAVFTGLAADTYTIEELDTLGYTASVSCTNGASGGSTVNVTVASGDEVTCTFTNRLPRPAPVPVMGPIGLGALALMLAGIARRRMR